jgi:hypothetical protein
MIMVMGSSVQARERYKGFVITVMTDGGFYRGTIRREDGRPFSILAMTERTFTAFDLPSVETTISSTKMAIDGGDYG